MSNIKEKILGAVTVMSDEDAEKVWALIQTTFALAHIPVVEPDSEEKEIISAYLNGKADYQPAMTHEELLKELDL